MRRSFAIISSAFVAGPVMGSPLSQRLIVRAQFSSLR